MNLAELIRGTSPAPVATLTVATPATLAADLVPTVASVATVTVAKPGSDAVDAATFRARWCEAALAGGFLPDPIQWMGEEDLAQYRDCFDACADWYAAAQAAASMLADSASMGVGRVPRDWTAAAVCRHCGPVWLHPDVVALLDVVDGCPWCIACPWCCVHSGPGKRIPHPHGPAGSSGDSR